MLKKLSTKNKEDRISSQHENRKNHDYEKENPIPNRIREKQTINNVLEAHLLSPCLYQHHNALFLFLLLFLN